MEPNHQFEKYVDALLAGQRRERDNDQEYRREIADLSEKLLDMYVTKHQFWATLLSIQILNLMLAAIAFIVSKLF